MDTEANRESLNERLRRTRQSLNEIRAETQAKARRAVRITNDYAHDHPWRMVATAATLAFAVGLLMRKSSRKTIVNRSAEIPAPKAKQRKSKGSAWEAINAFMPIALFAAKNAMAARSKKSELAADIAALP